MNSFIGTKRVNIFFAYLAIAFGLFSLVFVIKDAVTLTNQYMDAVQSGALTVTSTTVLVNPELEEELNQNTLGWSVSAILGFIVSLASFIFQSLCNYQWAGCLNRNITKNAEFLILVESQHRDDEEISYDFTWMIGKLTSLYTPQWPFFVYIGASLLGVVFHEYNMMLSLIGFVFLSIYLAMIFRMCNELIDIKSQFYSFYLKSDYDEGLEYTIQNRNIFLFFFLSILTLGLYWYYLLFKLTNEINLFLERDEKLMEKLPDSPVINKNGDDDED